MISCGQFRLDSKNLNWFINWQVSQLLQSNTYLHTILASQQLMLRVTEYRAPFHNSTCLDKMLNILSTRISFQVSLFMIVLKILLFRIFLLSLYIINCEHQVNWNRILSVAVSDGVLLLDAQFQNNVLFQADGFY